MENEKENSVENAVVVGLNDGNESEISSRKEGDFHSENDLIEAVILRVDRPNNITYRINDLS